VFTAGQFAQSATLHENPAGSKPIGYEKSYDNQPHIFALSHHIMHLNVSHKYIQFVI